jgi:hypothetical protein
MKAGFFSFGEQSRTNDVRRNAIDHWACAETPGFPQGAKERSHEPEAATMAVPAAATARFVAAAMTAARHFATAHCRAKADRAGAFLSASYRVTADQAGAFLAETNYLATAADRAGASLAASYHAPADQGGASLDVPPAGAALRDARRSEEPADRGVAGRHRIAFRREIAFHPATAVRYAPARRRLPWPDQSCVQAPRRLSGLWAPLTRLDA